MAKEYVHDIQREVRSISGWYELEEEKILESEGREVLYTVGNGVVDSSCCGVGGCRFAVVPGYILKLKTRQNDSGLWISEVEPVTDEAAKNRIKRLIEENEVVQQVRFL